MFRTAFSYDSALSGAALSQEKCKYLCKFANSCKIVKNELQLGLENLVMLITLPN